MVLDEDGQQEYALARLEGCTRNQATKRAVSATNDNSRPRQLRKALRFDERWAEWGHYRIIGLDQRSDEEREADWARREEIRGLLGYCNDKQRAVLELRHGLHTGDPMTMHETADALGYRHHSSVQQLENSGLRAIRRKATEAATLAPDELARLEAKREYNRNKLRRWRAQQRKEAA